MLERYKLIMMKLKEARSNDNKAAVKTWRTKLSQWQNEYGACAPIQ